VLTRESRPSPKGWRLSAQPYGIGSARVRHSSTSDKVIAVMGDAEPAIIAELNGLLRTRHSRSPARSASDPIPERWKTHAAPSIRVGDKVT